MLHIFHGPDSFSRHEALEKIKKELGEFLEANTSSFEGDRVNTAELSLSCQTAPFLAPKRLVVVKGLLERFELWKDRKTEDPGPFFRLLEALPSTTELVLIEDRLLGDANPLFAALRGKGQVRAFPRVRGARLRHWIGERVAGGGGAITSGAVELLARVVGDDLWTLSQEIEKLLLFCRGKPITEDEVGHLSSPAREVRSYELADALLEGKSRGAGRLLHQLLQEGLVPAQLLAAVTRQLRHALLAQELLDQGLKTKELGERLGLSDYPLEKTLAQARFPRPRLEMAYYKILGTDLAIKTGKLSGELALELLVAELSG
jgi:DNA polymerase-3 subunit delta